MQDLSVLVLEDEPFQRLVTVTALQPRIAGKVLEAANGREALQVLESCAYVDIAICDLCMAGMDGLEFLRLASATGKIRSVILCSGVDSILRQATVSMIRCLGMNFLGDLGKPFNLEHFMLLSNRYLAGRSNPPRPLLSIELPTLDDVLRGLDNHEFEAYFQPKVALCSAQVLGAEVLARWNHPQLGVLPPAYFLPLMENSELVEKMFWQLFEQGLALRQRLDEQGHPLVVAFNLHPAQLVSTNLTKRIPFLLKQYQVPAASVMFEITESGMISAPASSLESLVRLRLMGCGLAMDDFGAGYSSLDRLSQLPFSQIKLDRTFVQKMQEQPRSCAIISCAVALANALGISLVIEGVERPEQRTQLIELGGTLAQGFLFARPMPESHFLDYCLNNLASKAAERFS